MQDCQEEEHAEEEEPKQGFYLEYVLHACLAAEQDAPAPPGPHTIEVVLKGASLHWPYLTQLDFVLAIAEAYSHCFIKPGAVPNPLVRDSNHTCCCALSLVATDRQPAV